MCVLTASIMFTSMPVDGQSPQQAEPIRASDGKRKNRTSYNARKKRKYDRAAARAGRVPAEEEWKYAHVACDDDWWNSKCTDVVADDEWWNWKRSSGNGWNNSSAYDSLQTSQQSNYSQSHQSSHQHQKEKATASSCQGRDTASASRADAGSWTSSIRRNAQAHRLHSRSSIQHYSLQKQAEKASASSPQGTETASASRADSGSWTSSIRRKAQAHRLHLPSREETVDMHKQEFWGDRKTSKWLKIVLGEEAWAEL